MVNTEQLTEKLPQIKISESMRNELNQVVAEGQLSNRISDHVRMALKLYLQGIDRSRSNAGIYHKGGQ